MTTPAEEKTTLRLSLKRTYKEKDMRAYVASAVEQLVVLPAFVTARHVLAYSPIAGLEIPFIAALREHTKEKRWYFAEVVSDEEMVFADAEEKLYRETAHTIVIVPSLALDAQGIRLGKGGGYFDRFLHAHASLGTATVSVVPDFALLEYIPVEEHDVRIAYPLVAHADH